MNPLINPHDQRVKDQLEKEKRESLEREIIMNQINRDYGNDSTGMVFIRGYVIM